MYVYICVTIESGRQDIDTKGDTKNSATNILSDQTNIDLLEQEVNKCKLKISVMSKCILPIDVETFIKLFIIDGAPYGYDMYVYSITT